ncbi:MAG: nicotinate-nucleotide adenylyltransferase [Verrucomicrobia bacterium]|nr:nicotinate-nucleotide adenylyltransferase [Verrucomicrobiota bacterium]MCF7708130.1 nicotinate-nucleotide adenylyltransferase [Verrucomicrobiota bacterium]
MRFPYSYYLPTDSVDKSNITMKRIGLFGGTFDPVHLGHLLAAQTAVEELELDTLFFIPAARSPFKPDRVSADVKYRAALLRIALAGRPEFGIDLQELERGGLSYTIHTVRNYRQWFPRAKLFFLIGQDHLKNLPEWQDAQELAESVEFIVLLRPGESYRDTAGDPFSVRMLRGIQVDISSSEIRERVSKGLSIEWFVPYGVAEMVKTFELYSTSYGVG